MKKTLLTIALLACAFAGQAQFVVSLYLNGNKPTFAQTTDQSTLYRLYNYKEVNTPNPDGSVTTTFEFEGFSDSTISYQDKYATDDYIALGGGLKIGYQYQRLQFGLAGTFNWSYSTADQNPARYLSNNPYCDVETLWMQARIDSLNIMNHTDSMILEDYQGWYKEYCTSFTISPYVRYEVLQAGDLALFVEANGFFTKINKPKHYDYLDWTYKEMHSTIDTSLEINRSTISFGALVTPGLSWQINPHCLVDLYFDFLSLGYRKTIATSVQVIDEYDYVTTPRVLSRRTTVTTTSEDTHIGFDLQAAPMAARNYRTWVRVGFSYTF